LITIIGDSWGCGEWRSCQGPNHNLYQVAHLGLEQYLTDAGHQVTNLSGSNKQNEEALDFLENHLKITQATKIVFWFVTCPLRTTTRHIYNNPYEFGIYQLITQFKYVDQLAAKHNVKVYAFGGLCDLPKEIIQQQFDNITIEIPSVSSLVIENFPQSIFGDVKELNKLKSTEMAFAVANMIEQKYNAFEKSNFFPDNGHPDREVHFKIFQQIKQYV
jgi:hypothetical protein